MPTLISTSGIAAQAFTLLKQRPISSFADDSETALQAAAAYDEALRESLEVGDWSFASQLMDLNEVDEATATDYVAATDMAHGYQLPPDFVRIREVEPSYAKWRLDLGYLRADAAGPLRIRYTAKITDELRLPSSFRIVVAYKMAALLPNLLRDDKDMDRIIRNGAARMKDALTADRAQQSARKNTPDDMLDDWATEALL